MGAAPTATVTAAAATGHGFDHFAVIGSGDIGDGHLKGSGGSDPGLFHKGQFQMPQDGAVLAGGDLQLDAIANAFTEKGFFERRDPIGAYSIDEFERGACGITAIGSTGLDGQVNFHQGVDRRGRILHCFLQFSGLTMLKDLSVPARAISGGSSTGFLAAKISED
ncbi:hypothetical protein DESC_310034 [Desulfosarcina cetonica]|nr:hypothetical protein DESC_310034 [Desulfosarcina cetonica]